ncbi:hypothetical protein EB001_23820, partial [bacterium]|nr:hypothetical protein [bacterium]
GGWENWKMIEIEEFACENGRQAQKREQYYMDLFKSNSNSIKSFFEGTQKEYFKQYNIENKEQKKQYRLDNKEHIQEKQAQYRLDHKEQLLQKFTCECGSTTTISDKTKHYKTKKHLDFVSSI